MDIGVGDIGLAGSTASSAAATLNAGTTFNFNSAGARGDIYASETGASSSASASGLEKGLPTWAIVAIAIGGIVVIGGVVYYTRKKKR